MDKEDLFAAVDDEADRLREIARRIWETPELAYEESRSARYLADALERDGFDVEFGVGGLPTAFRATYGDGEPTIGLLGEYDALPGLSQKVSTEREPLEEGGAGHGCGHNLHGTGALGGALAAKRAVEEGGLDGTVAFFGCPAEETLGGTVYMARAGAFDDLDAAMAWHPGDASHVRLGTANALDSVEYVFEGESAHAAASPEGGRSALDGVQLMTTGVEYMREHVPDRARVHYVITDGGDAPNVVPSRAAAKFFVRSPSRDEVARLSDWVDDIAEGAAKMTQTSATRRFITGCHGYLPNETLGLAAFENMRALGPIEYTDEEREFAADLRSTIAEEDVDSRLTRYPELVRSEMRDSAIYDEPVEPFDRDRHSAGTADLGDVCWVTPTVQFRAATWPAGTPPHTWQAVAASGDLGRRGMVYAAKVFAGTVYDLLTEPSILEEAAREHEDATGGREYECAVPADVEPPTVDEPRG
jgi:aminobenzoyl-glutamate utilization protein B